VTAQDDRFAELRRLVGENDRAIVDAVNRRLELVEELWRLKAERGDARLDPEREQHLRKQLLEANRGPLSDDGLDRLVGELLELTKRELGGTG
jgi:3-deoxy-7-phosphoheptulonate synthase/chorismate mutase